MTRILSGVLVCLIANVLLAPAASAQTCTLKEYASLDLLGLPDAPVVQVSIGGKSYNFIVDTGGVFTMLDQDVVDALGLKTNPISNNVEIYDVSGRTLKKYVDVPDVSIGPIKLGQTKMVVREKLPGEGHIDGTLAPDLISQFELDFDFAAKKLNLFSQDHCVGKVAYWAKSYADVDFTFDGDHIRIPITLDGHDFWALLDTGSTNTYISETISRSSFGLESTSPGMEPVPDSTKENFVQFRYRFKSLSLNGLVVTNPLVGILSDRVQQAFRSKHENKQDLDPIYGTHIQTPQVILGLNVLTKLHLFISYKEHKLYMTASDAH